MPLIIPVTGLILAPGPRGWLPENGLAYGTELYGGIEDVAGFALAPLSPPVNASQKEYTNESPSASLALKLIENALLPHTMEVSLKMNFGLELICAFGIMALNPGIFMLYVSPTASEGLDKLLIPNTLQHRCLEMIYPSGEGASSTIASKFLSQ